MKSINEELILTAGGKFEGAQLLKFHSFKGLNQAITKYLKRK